MLVYLDRKFFLSYCVFTLYLNFVFSSYAFKIIQITMTLHASLSGLNSTTSMTFLLQRPTIPGDPHNHPCNR